MEITSINSKLLARMFLAGAKNLDSKKDWINAVSYTHLDVYKRQLYDYLLVYYKRGLDAVIVQDIGVVKAIHEYFPSMEIHTSCLLYTSRCV